MMRSAPWKREKLRAGLSWNSKAQYRITRRILFILWSYRNSLHSASGFLHGDERTPEITYGSFPTAVGFSSKQLLQSGLVCKNSIGDLDFVNAAYVSSSEMVRLMENQNENQTSSADEIRFHPLRAFSMFLNNPVKSGLKAGRIRLKLAS